MPTVDPKYHPAFPQPDDPNTLVWCYMDFAKFVAILLREQLSLVRLDQLPDQFEGTYPKKAQDAFIAWLRKGGVVRDEDIESHLKNFRRWSLLARKMMYVSCWRLGNYESEAMWRIYCGTDNGIAIALPYGDMFSAVVTSGPTIADRNSAVPLVGEVTYMNFREETYEPGNSYGLAMHKRQEFEYEGEVRIVRYVASAVRDGAYVDPPADTPLSVPLPWPANLTQKIVFSPYARSWYKGIVLETIERLAPALSARVSESSMNW
jgi:hypothetical protein